VIDFNFGLDCCFVVENLCFVFEVELWLRMVVLAEEVEEEEE
jgi:hypothetical protein